MPDSPKYIVAAAHAWNREVYESTIKLLPGKWSFAASQGELGECIENVGSPRYIFFLHWSWKVPNEIIDRFECVAFHMADVPYGRGGSPLQNLIVRGHRDTKLTALRMTDKFDEGPVYLKEHLDLAGTAQQIYERAAKLSAVMIGQIVSGNPEPVPQSGSPTVFRRRTPAQSELPPVDDAEKLYDFIRMLDAPGYPHAFIRSGKHRVELTNAAVVDGVLSAQATFISAEWEQ